ncbi:hypothetical protein [Sanguibacter sp. 25GB23B1]|uniref:hypothetical protein n=1 Tax=unclassified Sanguibacter TaxID=2645534 RepID=UPI0032AF892E
MNPSVLTPYLERALRFLVLVGETSRESLTEAVRDDRVMYSFSVADMDRLDPGARLIKLDLAKDVGGRRVAPTSGGERMMKALDAVGNTELESGGLIHREPVAIVGNPTDPIFYASILTELTHLENVLFVDRYLPAQVVGDLASLSSIRSILTGPGPVADEKVPNDTGERRLDRLRIQAGIGGGVSIRLSKQIHDRYALPDEGSGYIIGASLGGVKLTTMVQLSESATVSLRLEHEKIWDEATPVERLGR